MISLEKVKMTRNNREQTDQDYLQEIQDLLDHKQTVRSTFMIKTKNEKNIHEYICKS